MFNDLLIKMQFCALFPAVSLSQSTVSRVIPFISYNKKFVIIHIAVHEKFRSGLYFNFKLTTVFVTVVSTVSIVP